MKIAQFLVGVVFLVGIGFLIFFTLMISGVTLGQETVSMQVRFESVGGLVKGNKVMIMGTEMGKVRALRPVPHEGYVLATLELKEKIVLGEGYKIEIRPSSVLGGTQVWINIGDFRRPVVEKVYTGESVDDVMKMANELMDKLNTIADDIKSGNGTLSKLINDSALYDEGQRILREFRELVEDQREHAPISAFTSMFGAF